MFQSAQDYCVVKVKTKYIGNFTNIMKMAAIQNNTSIEPADLVNLVGEVVSAPKSISNKRELQGFTAKDILSGDTVIMSHNVIFDFEMTAPEEDPIYKNSVWYKGQEYFVAHISHIFATIRDGKIRMQNGYVMLEELEKQPKIYMAANVKRSISTSSAVISHIGKNIEGEQRVNAEVGDRVFFKPNILQLYQINNRPFGIVRQKDLLGREKR
jgi:hypothetical protein